MALALTYMAAKVQVRLAGTAYSVPWLGGGTSI